MPMHLLQQVCHVACRANTVLLSSSATTEPSSRIQEAGADCPGRCVSLSQQAQVQQTLRETAASMRSPICAAMRPNRVPMRSSSP